MPIACFLSLNLDSWIKYKFKILTMENVTRWKSFIIFKIYSLLRLPKIREKNVWNIHEAFDACRYWNNYVSCCLKKLRGIKIVLVFSQQFFSCSHRNWRLLQFEIILVELRLWVQLTYINIIDCIMLIYIISWDYWIDAKNEKQFKFWTKRKLLHKEINFREIGIRRDLISF
jgi:hypothetical protein